MSKHLHRWGEQHDMPCSLHASFDDTWLLALHDQHHLGIPCAVNARSLMLATFAVLAATGCSNSSFELRNDGVIVFDGKTSSLRNMDESTGVFVREGGCVLFETSDGRRVAPVLFEGIRFGDQDLPEEGLLVLGREYRVQALTSGSPLLEDDSADQLAAECGAPLAFAGAVSPIEDGFDPKLPPTPKAFP